MAKPKPSLTAALAQKQPPPVAAAEPAPASRAKPPKVDEGTITTSLRIKRELLADLKGLALQRRCSVNDLLVQGAEDILALNGRKSAA